MKQMKHKIICLLSALSIMLIPIGFNVFAETDDEKIKQYSDSCDVEMLINKYKLSLEKVSGTSNQYRIFVNGKKDAVGAAEFKVTEVKTGNIHGGIDGLGTIKYGQDLYFNADSAIPSDGGEKSLEVSVSMLQTLDGCLGSSDSAYGGDVVGKKYEGNFYIILSITDTAPIINNNNTSNQISNPHIGSGKICTNFINGVYDSNQFNKTTVIKKDDFDKFNYAAVSQEGKTFYKELIPYCFSSTVNAKYEDTELVSMIGNAISIWKSYTTPVGNGTTSFQEEFNKIRDAAIAAGTSQGSLSSPLSLSATPKLSYDNKCEYNQTEYAEKNYYAAKIVDTQTVKYSYNYAPGYTGSETKKICDKICEESVKVEYGPPVASKAGLCFEYTVKVTSYVQCSADPDYSAEPKYTGAYCTPNVLCVSTKGTVRQKPQAGPSEEFEQCIRSCDGGKYTQQCSLKCYQEVYNDKTNLKISYANIAKNSATKTSYSESECLQDNPDGCYVKYGGWIGWIESVPRYGNSFDPDMLGRYYHESGYDMGLIWSGRYAADPLGFSRAVYANGAECSDNCEWVDSCPYGMYLNPNTAAKDYYSNLAQFRSAITACDAAATCSRKTATFTIAVKYDTKDGDTNTTVNKVYYPYTSNAQHKKNPTENASEYNTISKDTFTNGNGYKNDSSTIIDYNGCYDNVDNRRWYLTEWGFPGTYINNKTGEISFATPSDLSGWYLEKKKFCIPLNAESVNKKWWEWKIIGKNCISESEILEELQGKSGTSNGYNIEAIAKNFGYFGWNFNIKCFYAIRNEVCDTDKEASKCCPKTPTGGSGGADDDKEEETTGYIVRTVDPKNLFPNSGYNVAEEQRREIGFNWTQGASILSAKNSQYRVNPEELAETIEKNSDILYSEEPDYQFYLTPSDLTKLRRYNDKYTYTTWNGTSSSVNGVNSYKSNLFRAVGTEANVITNTAKKIGTPGVNNE